MQPQKASSTRRQKRATTDDTNVEPRKRRARYALRACCECKRRKVRCDGHMPCEHCQNRSIECLYDTDPQLLTNCACNASHQINDCSEHESDGKENPSEIGRLSRLVESMQAQMNMLIEFNKPPNYGRGQGANPTLCGYKTPDSREPASVACSDKGCSEIVAIDDSTKYSSPRYWGATSSDYTLNVVQFCIRPMESQLVSSCGRRRFACSHQDPASYSPTGNYERVECSRESWQRKRACFCSECTRCLRRLGRTQALQLVDVYEEVIGYLHPVVDINHLKSLMNSIFSVLESGTQGKSSQSELEQDCLDIAKLVLSVALLAQTTGKSDTASALHDSVQSRIQDATTSPVKNIRRVVLTLLAAIYNFFHDDVQLAWRMGGIAGRMAMELGLHHRDTRERAEDESGDHSSITNILWSIVILDRLWSCTIGLPQNFQDADFAKSLPEPVEAPYLKAMVSYASFTPRLWDHNSRLLTTAAIEDEDLFDVTNIQIDQWKERFLADLSFVHPKDRVTDSRPQPLSTLLYLRANLVRGLVVTSYFLSCSRLAGKKRMAQSGIELACDTICILSDLDATTDIYRKQHPFFQHFLASSVALLFLVLMHESESKEHPQTSIGEKNLPRLSKSISRAFSLAEVYSEVASASQRLWKRMKSMTGVLSKLGISYTEEYSSQVEPSWLTHLGNDVSKCKLPVQGFSAGQVNRFTDETLLDNSRVRQCSPNMVDHDGALCYLNPETVFGLVDDIPSVSCGAEAYLNDISGFESDIDNQTWRELGAIFSQGL
ncbi:hypothetical protein V8C42DRAFT_201340 [Trichoderma barbatum]